MDPLKKAELNVEEKKILYFCDECGKGFKSKKGRKNHTHELNRERIKCSECVADFAGPSSLYNHVINIHGKVKYPCDQCDYRATLKQCLENHIQSVHLKTKWICKLCNEALSSRAYLLKHTKAVHEKKKYSCEQCPDKEYTFYCGLKKHKDVVHDGIYHICDMCGHKSSTKFHLKTHKKVHRNIGGSLTSVGEMESTGGQQ